MTGCSSRGPRSRSSWGSGLHCAIGVAGALVAVGCAAPTVTRSIGGELIEGRFISPYAYTLYAIGANAEARGEFSEALEAFSRAERADAGSAEIWTRIGALRCRLGGDAEAAFEKAMGRDARYEPLWRERARCAREGGRFAQALGFAEQAVALDPDQEEAWLLLVELLEKQGRGDEARRALRGWTVRHPRSVTGWVALSELARRQGDEVEATLAARRAAALSPRHAGGFAQELPGFAPLLQVDAALERGDLEEARRCARKARLSPAELSVRAAALGRTAEAHAQAELVLGADPASGSARIALAVASDLVGDEAGLREAWRGMPGAGEVLTPPSTLARLLFAELLARRVDGEAAKAWLGPVPEGSGDALTVGVAERVRRRLAGQGIRSAAGGS
ncbi:tetratricopeptide repeat protein [Chondromyces crocatus]|uniref:Uncharacterized protein n=1 Tax=Chondromyces crocatus TaxID=52 RepID=A0A0K1EGA6_CHOCO|nr:tetratricopeptide repeat protein [Chondromyces crocatus]AKT39905.1 uncharacterized protein CMC5_040560 [Chondromyces crocatus]